MLPLKIDRSEQGWEGDALHRSTAAPVSYFFTVPRDKESGYNNDDENPDVSLVRKLHKTDDIIYYRKDFPTSWKNFYENCCDGCKWGWPRGWLYTFCATAPCCVPLTYYCTMVTSGMVWQADLTCLAVIAQCVVPEFCFASICFAISRTHLKAKLYPRDRPDLKKMSALDPNDIKRHDQTVKSRVLEEACDPIAVFYACCLHCWCSPCAMAQEIKAIRVAYQERHNKKVGFAPPPCCCILIDEETGARLLAPPTDESGKARGVKSAHTRELSRILPALLPPCCKRRQDESGEAAATHGKLAVSTSKHKHLLPYITLLEAEAEEPRA